MNTKILRTLEYDKIQQALLRQVVTANGQKMVQNMTPQTDPEKVQRALDETADGASALRLKGGIPVPQLENIDPALKRVDIGAVLNGQELASISRVLQTVSAIDKFLTDLQDQIDFRQLYSLQAELTVLPQLSRRLKTAVDPEGTLTDEASPELHGIREQIKRIEGDIRGKMSEYTRGAQSKYLSDPIVTIRDDRYVIPVKAAYRAKFGGVVHDQSATGQTLFVEPQAIVALNNRLREAQMAETAEINRVLAELSNELAPYTGQIKANAAVLGHFDFINAKAKLAKAQKATEPLVSAENDVLLRHARHPLIDPHQVVGNDIPLGADYQAMVITGPNTGGKTVTIKTIGLLTLMAQCGLHIPVSDDSRVKVFRRVLADVGDEQSIAQSLSTFSSHMVNIVGILGEADDETLILFDELGAGTDPIEGAALAAAIIESAREMGALVAATTHYAELKVYAMTTPGVENASCEFNVDSLAPTYRLLIGIPGKSNAFAISERLGLPKSIIQKAAARIDAENVRFEDVLTQLDEQRQEMEREKEAAARLRREMEETAKASREYKAKMEAERAKAVEKAQAEARAILDEARDTADQVFKELNDMRRRQRKEEDWQRVNDERAALRRSLNEAEGKLGARPEEPAPPPTRPARAGDTVELVKMGTQATVLSVNKDGSLQLQAGILKITARQEEVRVVEGETQQSAKKVVARAEHKLRTLGASPEVDLRGMMTDEAIGALDLFLDNAVLGKLNEVRIIHGKGTGAVRKAVREHLKRSRYVKSFRPGRYGEGEDGVTIAELR